MGLAIKVGGTFAGSGDAGSQDERPSVSVFGTIHPDLFDLRRPIGAEIPNTGGVRLASLETGVTSDAAADAGSDSNSSSPRYHASFEERFGPSFAARFASLSSFDDRFAPSFDRFAMPIVGALPAPRMLSAGVPASDGAKRDAARAVAVAQPVSMPATVAAPQLAAAPKSGQRVADLSGDVNAPSDAAAPDNADSRTAIYDITARAVYLPDGTKLEAHSGLGMHLDDPRAVHVKNLGPTPPNVYDLAWREASFHGVRAIRLIPAGEGKMYGRDGILAHPYMLGPNGQSNGCVSFRDYPAFVSAFSRGEVDRLVVVEHLANPPNSKVAANWIPEPLRRLFKRSDQYAAASNNP
jgi:hypothetical protein